MGKKKEKMAPRWVPGTMRDDKRTKSTKHQRRGPWKENVSKTRKQQRWMAPLEDEDVMETKERR